LFIDEKGSRKATRRDSKPEALARTIEDQALLERLRIVSKNKGRRSAALNIDDPGVLPRRTFPQMRCACHAAPSVQVFAAIFIGHGHGGRGMSGLRERLIKVSSLPQR
jgi:hypothetical protein